MSELKQWKTWIGITPYHNDTLTSNWNKILLLISYIKMHMKRLDSKNVLLVPVEWAKTMHGCTNLKLKSDIAS